jgi:hypothetical protein
MIPRVSPLHKVGSVQLSVRHVRIQIVISPMVGRDVPNIDSTIIHLLYIGIVLNVDYRWLYRLLLAIDANFRLKNKDRPGVKADAPLGDGWGHWVPENLFMSYVNAYGYQVEVCHCIFVLAKHLRIGIVQPNLCDSELHAVDHANAKYSSGYRATGVGAVVCARHGLVRKNGLGDLQKGERYLTFCVARFPPTLFV